MILVRHHAAPAFQFFNCLDVNKDDLMSRAELTGLLDAIAAVCSNVACIVSFVLVLMLLGRQLHSACERF